MSKAPVSAGDREILRRLAARKVELADDPVNRERREAWYRLDAGAGERVMVLAEPFGVRDACSPGSQIRLECEGEWARGIEGALRREAFVFDRIRDDRVIEPCWNIPWAANFASGFGVDIQWQRGDNSGHMAAGRWDPPLKDLDRDPDKLTHRTFKADRQKTLLAKAQLEDLFGDILRVRIRGAYWWTLGLTQDLAQLVGIEEMMLAMYDNPAAVHRIMRYLHDDFLAFAEWLEREGLYTPNNENDGIGSGSLGYTRDLPRADLPPGAPLRMKDLWVTSESQETVGVGPELFEEFIFPYQLSLAERFGKCYYGCCEPVHSRIHILKRMPNLARVSVSPWADEEVMARELGRDYVYSRKPNPSMLSTDEFDEDAIRADIRRTLEAARGCRIEIIMKDLHTLKNQPERLPRWVELVRQVIEETHA